MIFRHQYQGGVWVDLEQPTEDEIRQITREFSINKRIERELLAPTPMPLVITDADATLLVLHFPAPSTKDGDTASQELDFVVGKHYIVTSRYEVIAPLYHLKKLLETQGLVGGRDSVTTEVLLEVLFAHLYTAVRNHTNHIASRLERIEKDMFEGKEQATVRSISNISRAFLHMESVLANQQEALKRFLDTLDHASFFGPSFAERTVRILTERSHVAHLVTTHRAIAAELRETNTALLSAKQNEVIKILTVVSFIFLPLALIAKVFAMKVTYMPFVDDPNGFWVILGIMFFVAVVLTLFVSKKRWL